LRGRKEPIFAPILGACRFYGAYMIDIIKNHPLARAVNALLERHPRLLAKNIAALVEELDTLGKPPFIILIGQDILNHWKNRTELKKYKNFDIVPSFKSRPGDFTREAPSN
jgi:hypothetical protein